MEIFTYRAASLQEALMLVRHELGPDASVLQTREIAGKFFGLLGKRAIEVKASRDAKVARRLGPTDLGNESPAYDDAMLQDSKVADTDNVNVTHKHNRRQNVVATHAQGRGSENEGSFGTTGFDLIEDDEATHGHALLSPGVEADEEPEMAGRPSQLNQAYQGKRVSAHAPAQPAHEARPNYLSPAMFEVFTELLDSDVDPDAARLMLQEVAMHCTPPQMDDPWLIKGRLCQLVQQQIHVAGPIEMSDGKRHIVALVGPTGVGKTTTLAKLAAGFHFDQGLEVGFITLDTFRLGAVEQLQKYAELLGAACEVVTAPDQMLPALDRLAHCHLILIDTAGRSPRDESQISVLSEFLRVVQPTQTHLVLSAASSQAHAEMALEQFREVEPTHLLLTKLDESSCLGSWYRLLSSGVWPLSYITTGQNVPEDILVANRRRVASLILGQSNHIGHPRMR